MSSLTEQEAKLYAQAGLPVDGGSLIGREIIVRSGDPAYDDVVLRGTIGAVQTWEVNCPRVVITPVTPFYTGYLGTIVSLEFLLNPDEDDARRLDISPDSIQGVWIFIKTESGPTRFGTLEVL